MPMIMLSVDQIMNREKRDMYFLDMKGVTIHPTRAKLLARKKHFEWFAANNLKYESAAPRGWLEGDPGVYAVHFTGPDDSRLAAYTTAFERPNGISLKPKVYQMVMLEYQPWLNAGGPQRMAEDLAAEW